jgi:hypothetical protein
MPAFRIAGLFAALWVACAVSAASPAAADVLIMIDKASQRMAVAVDGRTRYIWPVSTGRSGYGTPSGRFRPQWMARTYFSKKYYDSPMPHSIFFYHGFAIHGTEYIHRLGGPASHGCVRLHPRAAATLYALVQSQGMSRTRIVIGEHMALQRPERWGANERGAERFITLMADRLMLAEQIERKDALAKMEQMRASDALRRIMERSAHNGAASPEEPAVAIGVQAEDQSAIPESVVRTESPVKLEPAAVVPVKLAPTLIAPVKIIQIPMPAARPRHEAHRPKPAPRPARAEQGRRKISSAAPGRPPARQAAFLAWR